MNNNLLYGLFSRLKAKGLPLGTRDFIEGIQAFYLYRERFFSLQDNISASKAGQGQSPVTASPMQIRTSLIWICETLWARSSREKKLIQEVINFDIPLANNEIFQDWLTLFNEDFDNNHFDDFEEKPVNYPNDKRNSADVMDIGATINNSAQEVSEQENQSAQSNTSKNYNQGEIQASLSGNGTLGITTGLNNMTDDDTNNINATVPIPILKDSPTTDPSIYNWNQPPQLDELWLLSLWRRMYKPIKRLDLYDIDINKTVTSMCESGVLLAPANSDRSYNTAEVLMLIDDSEQMAPWHATGELLRNTLISKLSRLRRAEAYYFNKMPGLYLHKTPTQSNPINSEPLPIEPILNEHQHSAIIIFSDAGAAANEFDYQRKNRLKKFLNESLGQLSRRIVWINPMPMERWPTEFNQIINENAQIHTCTLSPHTLLQAIEYLKAQ